MMLTDTDTDYNSGVDQNFTNKMDVLTYSINDASRSMKSIERLHREMNSQHTNDMEMLKDEIARHHQEQRLRNIQSELSLDTATEMRRSPPVRPRTASSPSRQFMNEDTIYYVPTASGKLRRTGSVRFVEEGGGMADYHEIHQSLRDLTNEHTRLREEIQKQGRGSSSGGGPLRDHVDHVRRAHSSDASAAAADVEKRLHAVQEELKAERRQLDRRHADLGLLSPALNAALDKYRRDATVATERQVPVFTPSANPTPASAPPDPTSSATSESLLRSRLKQSEASRQGVEAEVDGLKRKLDHMEGSNQAMQKRVTDYQSQMMGLERENKQLRGKLEEVEAISHRLRHRQEEEEVTRRDKARLEREMFELRTQLSQTVAVSDLEDTRRNKDKAERQRDDLQDQVLTLTRNLEKKERSLSKLLDELRETQLRADSGERMRTEASAREEAAERELKEARRREEALQDSVRVQERQLYEGEQAREQLRLKSSDSIKQLKGKNARYQKEIERLREAANESSGRAEDYSQEIEGQRRQMQCLQAQCDAGRREIEELLAARTRFEDQLKSREDEIESLRLLKYELEARNESSEKIGEKLKHDAEALRHELTASMEERARLEEKLSASEAAHSVCQDQLRQAARDYKELVREKTELVAQHAEVMTQNQEKREHKSEVKELTKQIEDLRREEKKTVSDLHKKLRHLERDSAAQLQAMRIRFEEEKTGNRLLVSQNQKQGREIARLHDEYLHMDEELRKTRRKYEKARDELDSKISSTDMDVLRFRQIEEEVIDAREHVTRLERELAEVMRSVTAEIDGLVEVAAEDLSQLRATLIPPGHDGAIDDSARWLAEIQAKIGWVKMEFRHLRSRETQLKEECCQARDHLQSADQLVEELKEENQREHSAVSQLVDEIRHLEDNLEIEKTVQLRQKLDMFETISASKLKSDAERDTMRIQERYLKLQKQLNTLRPEFSPVLKSPSPSLASQRMSPIMAERSASIPPEVGNRKVVTSPTPMNMTDNEFREKFMPRASPLLF